VAAAPGKSTVARQLAADHGRGLYHAEPWRWVNRPPEVMLETFHGFAGEGFDLVLDDLLALPPDPPVLAEGFSVLPRLVAPLLSLAAAGRLAATHSGVSARGIREPRVDLDGHERVGPHVAADQAVRRVRDRPSRSVVGASGPSSGTFGTRHLAVVVNDVCLSGQTHDHLGTPHCAHPASVALT
jgi:hypothetical protein